MEKEKNLERKLVKKVKEIGGLALKIPAIHYTGIPDRLCLFPGGRVLFVEVKTTGEKPRKIQIVVHNKLRGLGFRVDIVDRSEQIEKIISEYA